MTPSGGRSSSPLSKGMNTHSEVTTPSFLGRVFNASGGVTIGSWLSNSLIDRRTRGPLGDRPPPIVCKEKVPADVLLELLLLLLPVRELMILIFCSVGLILLLNRGPRVGMHAAAIPRNNSATLISCTLHILSGQSGEFLVLIVTYNRQPMMATVLRRRKTLVNTKVYVMRALT
ncbi:hypothetical protein F5Y16DRAFT_60360 [Xylariaceae sp. FL0255]|nr:hypothetical protein F5Y16DRAFT_60360 [Xylariaceae sp. FL0255]